MSIPKVAVPEFLRDLTNYERAIQSYGARPTIITLREYQKSRPMALTEESFHVEDFEGLVLPGGADVNPALYGEERMGARGIDEELDHFQLRILDAFVKAGKPVLGICRGLQLINVYFGGTLIQDLSTAWRHARNAPASRNPDKVHPLKARGWLGDLYGAEFSTNSSHHEAIDRLGEGLILDAFCRDDEVAEAIHHESLPIYGVQFHPERMCLAHERKDTVDGGRIFSFFVSQLEKG